MCGKECALFKSMVEGSEMNVCSQCSKFGKVVSQIKEPLTGKKQAKLEIKMHSNQELILSVVLNYSEIIKSKRGQLGLNQEDFAKQLNEKISVIHKMETGH